MNLDPKALEVATRAVFASKAFQPAGGEWQGNNRVSERAAGIAAEAAILAYLSALGEQKSVAWQRLHPVAGWQNVDEADIEHYRSYGQEIRPLYASPLPVMPITDEDAVRRFKLGSRVTKTKGSSWTGRVVGFYSTNLTPIGYAVESENEPGSVQIYPEAALKAAGGRG